MVYDPNVCRFPYCVMTNQCVRDWFCDKEKERAMKERENLPYPWCIQPEICINKGYCPRDPNCGD